MLTKVLICWCFFETFCAEGNNFSKKLLNLCCKCREKHTEFVLFCERHPFGEGLIRDGKCSCSSRSSRAACTHCGYVCYILNLRTFKMCMENVPQNVKDKMLPINEYLKNIKCGPFFVFDTKSNNAFVSLPKIEVNEI